MPNEPTILQGRPQVLVLGAGGMLGHKVFQALHQKFPGTMCTTRTLLRESPWNQIDLLHGPSTIQGLDVLNGAALEQLLASLKPDFIINCVGIIKQRAEAEDAVLSLSINSLLPHKLAALSSAWNGRVIHFSTDCVFSGSRGGYTEDDLSDARDLYGRTKALGEVKAANCLVIRTSMIGRELVGHRSLLDWFLSQRGAKVRGFRRVIYSGVTTNYLARLVANIIENHSDLAGLFQVATEPISKHDLLCLIRDAYGIDVEIVPDDAELSDRSMKSDRLKASIGYSAPSWPELVSELAADPTPYARWLGK